MEEYCANCGAKLKDNAGFCSKCGEKVNTHLCPNCGADIKDNINFCDECGWRLKDKGKPFMNRKLLIIPALVIIIVIIVFAGQSIINQNVETQVIAIDEYVFDIPADFKLNTDKSNNKSFDGTNKYWENSNGDNIQIIINEIDSNDDGDVLLASLGGDMTTKYGRDGFYNKFTDGGCAFSFSDGDKTVAIVVSNDNLLDQIKLIE